MNSSWSWFDDNKKLRYYEFQTIFDILSFAENLPLRVLDYEALCQINIAELWYLNEEQYKTANLEDIKKQSNEFCHHVEFLFSEIKELQNTYKKSLASGWQEEGKLTDYFELEFQNIINKNKNITAPPAFNALKESIKQLTKLEESVWLNRPSNPFPVHSLFRHCEEWRWWIFFWFFCEREKLKDIADNDDNFSGNAFFIGSWEFNIQWINLDGNTNKYLLVVGPIYKEQGLNCTTKQFHSNYGQTLKCCYKAFHTCCTNDSLTHLAHNDIIRRMIHARIPISKQEVKKRVSSIKSILLMLQNGLNKKRDNNYSYNDIYVITYSLISLERMITRMINKGFNTGTYKFNFSFSHNNQGGMLFITIQFDKNKT